MKYPQLVSPRAVNAISDWLVSRLEQLGVESPQIYTRLLLSLLQSSVQVNDPIEFSNLEAFFATRKGGHSKRFHLPSDNETLKKLNAVQCLREIVSNEHETTAIELLVNELCEKLKDIEKRCQDLNDEDRFLADNPANIEQLPAESSAGNSGSATAQQQQHLCRNAQILTAHDTRRVLSSENALKDLDNDPKKRYFRAFPALTKEMEDSFRVWRRNAKSLTWPVVGRSIVVDSHPSSASASLSSTKCSSNTPSSDKIVEKKIKENPLEEEIVHPREVVDTSGCSAGSIVDSGIQTVAASSSSSKKKSKRRRNQALVKGKTTQNLRKITLSNSTSNPTPGGGKFYQQHHYGHHRNTSPAWDTDFKGCWEMGPDLIKEFLSRQKIATKRSRSNSDSMEHIQRIEHNSTEEVSKVEELQTGRERPTMKRFLDIPFDCEDDESVRHQANEPVEGVDYFDVDYDDETTFASMPVLIGNTGNPRRLYQREGVLQKPQVVCGAFNDAQLQERPDKDEQLDFASFKAKFNSNVEALWKDADKPQIATPGESVNSKSNANGISSAFYANTSLNALAPFKQDLWNFWSNYNQHHYDPTSTASMMATCLDESGASSGAGAGADIANTSDYFSMPSNLDDFDKSVGAVRRQNEAGAALGQNNTPSINVFLQNSIWSSSGDCVDGVGLATGAESDESFLYKVWHSNKKLSELDVGNKKDEMIPPVYRDAEISFNNNNVIGGNGAKLEFTPYSSLKWSEGINAGPPYNHHMRSNNAAAEVSMDTLQMADQKFTTFGSAATISGANWEAPIQGLNVQPDLKSWCASNPLSLTEMYGSDVCDSITQESDVEEDAMGPAVTLPNHCATSSGFVSYALIKQSGLIKPQSKPLQLQSEASASRMAKDYFRGSSEEENLLTSESTHFHPIENFVDGHSFSISSALDVVEFERSSSGYLCYDSTEYMEYTRNDAYVADEEVANSNSFASSASCQTNESSNTSAKDNDMLVIKFRVNRSLEIACQTEEVYFQIAAAKMAEQTLSSESPDMTTFYNKDLETATQPNNEDIIVAVTKAVVAAAKVAAQRGLDEDTNSSLPWVPVTAPHQRQQQSWLEYTSLCDEVDSCINKADPEQLNQFWSMQAVEKQCHQRRLSTNTFERMVDMDKNDENSIDSSSHTLWGMCAVCNSCDYGRSMPANRLLRDELKLEADEIMSDLRFMQDLYIGETADCCSDGTEYERNNEVFPAVGNELDNLEPRAETTAVDHVQASMLQKVNQLIEDLLKPEQTGKLMKMTCDSNVEEDEANRMDAVKMTNVWSLGNSDNANAHSWHYGNDRLTNIWQHEPEKLKTTGDNEFDESRKKKVSMKPMKLLRQVGGSLNEEDMYMDKINWEHEHLAKIWQHTASPAPTVLSFMQSDEAKKDENAQLLNNDGEEEPASVASQDLVEKKNLKNLQCTTRMSPTSNVLASATYKRVQQFLNTSAAKLKIAANRKRRHSASQNFYHQQQQLNINNNNNNNNSDKITDFNRYKQKIAATTSFAPEEMPLAHEPTKQTFITCKYWTTTTNGTQASLESAAAAMMLLAAATNSRNDSLIATTTPSYHDNNVDEAILLDDNAFGNTFSCLIDKNASILKHVAMMTRPLTR